MGHDRPSHRHTVSSHTASVARWTFARRSLSAVSVGRAFDAPFFGNPQSLVTGTGYSPVVEPKVKPRATYFCRKGNSTSIGQDGEHHAQEQGGVGAHAQALLAEAEDRGRADREGNSDPWCSNTKGRK